MNELNEIPLFRDYPELRERLPRVALADLPTPVDKVEQLGSEIGLDSLYIKRDDVSGPVYGGNKVRKLEFLFGRVLQTGAREVMTFGFAGSNHAAGNGDLCESAWVEMRFPADAQDNAHYVRRNLLAGQHFGARVYHYRNLHHLRSDSSRSLASPRCDTAFFPASFPPAVHVPWEL